MIIRIASHRGWDRVERALGYKPKGLFNFSCPGSYGLTEIQNDEWDKVKDIPSVTKSRKKRDDLYECWCFFEKRT